MGQEIAMEGEKVMGRVRRVGLPAWVTVAAALMGAAGPVALYAQAAPRPATRDTLGLPDTLGLADAVALALRTHPALDAAAAGLEGAAAAEREAKAARYPSLRLSGSAVHYQEPMMVAPLHAFDPQAAPAFDETLLQGEATAAYTVFDGGGRGARIDRARAERGAAAAELERSRARVVAGVSATYLRVLTNADVLAAHGQRLESLAAEEARVQALLAEGTAPPIQLLRIQAALEAGRADAVEARVALESTELELARLLSVPPSATRRERLATVELDSDGSSAPDRAAALRRAREANPDLLAAERSAAAAEAGAAVAKSARWPTIDGFGSYWERGGGETDFQGEWAAGVKVSVPVFTGGALGGRIAQAEAGARAARARTRHAELEVAGEVDAALAALEEATARAEALEAAVASQAAVVDTERVTLEVGAGVQTDYLTAEADLLAARAALARARHAALLARVELARVQGELDGAWIAEHLETR
jgi:outer membrane protein TolC